MDARCRRWVVVLPLCVLLILCSDFGSQTVRAVELMAVVNPVQPIKGNNRQLSLACHFIPRGGRFRKIILYYAGVLQVELNTSGLFPSSGGMVSERGFVVGSSNKGYLFFAIRDTLCADAGAELKCSLVYGLEGYPFRSVEETNTVQVEAPPLTPHAMNMSPPSRNVEEHTNVIFTCSGNVGRPAGEFHWYTSISGDTGPGQNRTSEAQSGPAVPASGEDSCTFERTSTLTLNLTRTAQDQKLVVRCRVSQKHGSSNVSACANPTTDFCQKSPEINVKHFGIRTVRAASVTATYSPNPAIKGSNSQLVLRCSYALADGEDFENVKLRYAGVERAILLSSGKVYPFATAGNIIRDRGYLQGSKDDRFLSFVLNNTLCDDMDAELKCVLTYASNEVVTIKDTTTVQIEAPPLAPEDLTMTASSVNVLEYSEVTFTCSGNVGRPAGELHWYTRIGSDTGPGQNRTSEAQQGTAVPASGEDSCTFERTSTLTLKMTRTVQDQKLVVRCRVSQTHGSSNLSACADPATDFCQKSPEINVQSTSLAEMSKSGAHLLRPKINLNILSILVLALWVLM